MSRKKPLPAPLVVFLDLLGIGMMLGIFALFQFGMQRGGSAPLKQIVSNVTPAPTEAAQAAETPAPDGATASLSATPEPTPEPAPGDFSAVFPQGDPEEDGVLGSYADENLRVVVKEEHTTDTTYYVADVWIRNILGYKAAFSGGKYDGGYSLPSDMASKNHAILALSGDCYKARPEGIVIRNGNLYRDTVSGDVCILYADGVMESYYEADFDLNAAVARGAYQGWSFGPKLIDNGQVPASYNTTDKIKNHNPRAAIGYFEPGHYCLVYVDGRQGETSKGMKLDELSQVMIDLGCVDAYNLDGGQSSMMVFQDQVLGQPYKGGREISDIIYFGGDDPQQ